MAQASKVGTRNGDETMAVLVTEARRSGKAAGRLFDMAAEVAPSAVRVLIKLNGGDLLGEVEEALIVRIEPTDHLRREAIRRRLGQIRLDLMGPDPCSPVELLVIDRAAVSWLALAEADVRVARLRNDDAQGVLQKRLDHAQRRFLALLKALDQLRRKTPASHRLNVQVLGDLRIDGPAETHPPGDAPLQIDVTPKLEVSNP